MLSRQHNFYQQFLAIGRCRSDRASPLGAAHAIRFYVLNDRDLVRGSCRSMPQFTNCYWMIARGAAAGAAGAGVHGHLPDPAAAQHLASDHVAGFRPASFLVLLADLHLRHRRSHSARRRSAARRWRFFSSSARHAHLASASWLFQFWLKQRGVADPSAPVHPALRRARRTAAALEGAVPFPARARISRSRPSSICARKAWPRFIETLHDETVDIVVFSLDERIIPQVREALLACEAEGVEAWVSADFIQTLFTRVQFDQFAGQPLLIYRTTPAISWELVAKRLHRRRRLRVLLLVLTSPPIMLVIACSIRLDSTGPVIFSQNRSGLHGRSFRMYKFRTMVTNAEQARAELEEPQRNVRPGLQGQERSARHAARPVSAPDQPRRTAPALERPARAK